MRAMEFITEAKALHAGPRHSGKVSKLPPGTEGPMSNLAVMKDLNPYYGLYRMMIVAAGCPEQSLTTSSVVGDVPVAMPYTEADRENLLASAKKMGVTVTFLTDKGSNEQADTHSKSPIPHNSGKQKKKNK